MYKCNPTKWGSSNARVKRLIVAYGNTGTVTRTSSQKGYATQKDILQIVEERDRRQPGTE